MSSRLLRAARRLAVALPLLAAGACASDRPTAPITTVEETSFAPALNVDLAASTPRTGGVYIRDLEEGEGTAVSPQSTVTLNYTLWLANGHQVESGTIDDPNEPFKLGTGQAIPGFEIGLVGMQPGGRRQILIPPAMAYGARGSGPIPGFAVLVFEVEMLTVE